MQPEDIDALTACYASLVAVAALAGGSDVWLLLITVLSSIADTGTSHAWLLQPDVQPEDIDALTACYGSLVAVTALAGVNFGCAGQQL